MNELTNDGADVPETEHATAELQIETPEAEQVVTTAPRSNIITEPLKSLRERGISSETKRYFGISDFAGTGLNYRTSHLSCEAAPNRFKGMFPGYSRFGWPGAEPHEQLPVVYNIEVLKDEAQCESGLFLVQGEADVWPMHQCGLAAMAIFGTADEEDVTNAAEELGGHLYYNTPYRELQLLFDNNESGRQWALQTKRALEALDIRCQVLSLGSVVDAPLGFSVTDLFGTVGFDATKFREAISMLQLVPPSMLEQWKADPTIGLPAAKNEADDLYSCLNETELEKLPEPECLVEDVVLSSGVTLLTGKENLGKSAIAIALGASVSLGIPWNGQPTKAGLVYYIAAEGAKGIHKRLKAWKLAMGIESTPHFNVLPMSLPLHDPMARDRLIRTIEHHTAKARSEAIERGEVVPDVALVIVDTLAKTRGTLDENSPNDMTLYLEALNELYVKIGPAVLVLHHNNRKDDQYRGSSSLTANSDGHLMVIGDSGSAQIILKVAKLKDFADGQQFVLQRKIVELGVGKNGKPINSVVFERDLDAEAELAAENGEEGDALTPKQKTALRVLQSLCSKSGGEGVASNVWLKAAMEAGISKPTYDKAKKKLIEEGAVLCEKAGTQYARFTPNPEFNPSKMVILDPDYLSEWEIRYLNQLMKGPDTLDKHFFFYQKHTTY